MSSLQTQINTKGKSQTASSKTSQQRFIYRRRYQTWCWYLVETRTRKRFGINNHRNFQGNFSWDIIWNIKKVWNQLLRYFIHHLSILWGWYSVTIKPIYLVVVRVMKTLSNLHWQKSVENYPSKTFQDQLYNQLRVIQPAVMVIITTTNNIMNPFCVGKLSIFIELARHENSRWSFLSLISF